MRLFFYTLFALLVMTQPSYSEDRVVNIYSYRQAYLIEPVLKEFKQKTGIDYNIVFAKKGLAERLKREGEYSPADVILTTDGSRMVELAESGLTQAVEDELLMSNIPKTYRDGDHHWFALTLRLRNLFTSKKRFSGGLSSYTDLAKPAYKNKICMRSGKHPYNVALIASMIAHNGVDKARQWLQGVKKNLARKPQGNDRAQISAVHAGLCDIAIANSYYYGKMLSDPEQRERASSVEIRFPDNDGLGTHVNASGMLMARYAPHKDEALELMRFLSDDAQKVYAEVNMEYPVKSDVESSDLLSGWGDFKADSLPLGTLFTYRSAALKLLDEVKFDL